MDHISLSTSVMKDDMLAKRVTSFLLRIAENLTREKSPSRTSGARLSAKISRDLPSNFPFTEIMATIAAIADKLRDGKIHDCHIRKLNVMRSYASMSKISCPVDYDKATYDEQLRVLELICEAMMAVASLQYTRSRLGDKLGCPDCEEDYSRIASVAYHDAIMRLEHACSEMPDNQLGKVIKAMVTYLKSRATGVR